MDTIFMNAENSKTYKPHVLMLFQILVFTLLGKHEKLIQQ